MPATLFRSYHGDCCVNDEGAMINKESITRILRLGDDSADVTDVQISSDTIEVTLQKKDQVMFCPE